MKPITRFLPLTLLLIAICAQIGLSAEPDNPANNDEQPVVAMAEPILSITGVALEGANTGGGGWYVKCGQASSRCIILYDKNGDHVIIDPDGCNIGPIEVGNIIVTPQQVGSGYTEGGEYYDLYYFESATE